MTQPTKPFSAKKVLAMRPSTYVSWVLTLDSASIDCFGMMDVLIDVALAQRATLLQKELTNFAQNGGVGFSATMTAIDAFPDFGTIHPDNREIILAYNMMVGKFVIRGAARTRCTVRQKSR